MSDNIEYIEGIKQNVKSHIVLIQLNEYAGNHQRELSTILIGPDEFNHSFQNPYNENIVKTHLKYCEKYTIPDDFFKKKAKTVIRNNCGNKIEVNHCIANIKESNQRYDSIVFFFKKELTEDDFNILKNIVTDYLKTKDVNVLNIFQYKNNEPIDINMSSFSI